MASSDESAGTQNDGIRFHNTTTTDDNTSSPPSSDEDDFVPVGFGYSMQQSNLDEANDNLKRRLSNNYDSQPASAAKKMKSEWVERYSDKAMLIMKQMGYEEDKGLGKSGQGRLEPIEPMRQEGRRGFGLKLEGLASAALQWKPEMEEVKIPEPIDWLQNSDMHFLDNLTMDDLDDWIVRAPKKLTIDDETRYCDEEILTNVLSSKSVFDHLNANDKRRARTKSNPFESIKGAIFLNRAAVKMANIDSLCDFMFTNPTDENGQALVKSNDLLYFADVCAGPGGFTEYILYKKKWEAKGFGFTLIGDNDFKLDEFYAGPPETFDPHYGAQKNGDVFDPENQESFIDYVLKQTDNLGVHFVMADGGFSVEGQENIQEILSKQLYLCQCLVAISILREKGHFVCKLFDLFTPFSIGIIYLMYKCFQEISICKPNTSRPANSERYLICKWKKPNTDTIRRHFFQINQELLDNSGEDVYEIVSQNVIEQDSKFIEYIIESNNRIGRNQIIGLIKIAAFCKDEALKEPLQGEYRQQCLEIWKIPDQIRKKPDVLANDALLAELLCEWKIDKDMMSHPAFELQSVEHLEKQINKSIYDWYFVPTCREETERNQKTFFLCKGGRNVLRLSGGKWESVELCLEVSPKTLIYGEIVTELIGEGKSQNKVNALHIIDGIALGGIDIRRLQLRERLRMCDKFARALNKPFKERINIDGNPVLSAPIRCKKIFALHEIQTFFDQMRKYNLKEGAPRLGFRIRVENDTQKGERFFVPGGLVFFNELNPPYTCALSKSSKKFYYHNSQNNESNFIESLPEHVRRACYASFRCSFNRRLLWKWTNIYQVEQDVSETNKDSSILFRDDINRYIMKISSR